MYRSLGVWDREPLSCVQDPLGCHLHSRGKSVLVPLLRCFRVPLLPSGLCRYYLFYVGHQLPNKAHCSHLRLTTEASLPNSHCPLSTLCHCTGAYGNFWINCRLLKNHGESVCCLSDLSQPRYFYLCIEMGQ